MFDRIQRSMQLSKQSWRVLMADKELMLLPVLSAVAVLVVCLSFALPMLAFTDVSDFESADDPVAVAAGLLFYIVSYTIAFFFQAAVVAGATERMRGGDPTLGSALAAARSRLGPILAWGVVAGTVGFVIKAIQERSELVGKIVMGLIGVAWSLATFFMVPVLVFEDADLKSSFKRSAGLFRQTWGETVVGSGGIGLVTFLAMVVVLLVAAAIFATGLQVVAIVVGVLGAIVVGVASSALHGIYTAALYRYATAGEPPAGFDADDLRGAFVAKG